MEDLVDIQIKELYRLNMPEGLKELMSDISREVLRAQPSDIYSFIADYLSVLLVTRDNLSVASQICSVVCECDCSPELYSVLTDIGLSDTDVEIAQEVIMRYFSKKKVNEGTLLTTLLRKTAIDDAMFPAILDAVRTAYLRHQAHNYTKYETSSDSDQDETTAAAAHTLKLYHETRPTEEEYGEMKSKIQKSYRAYGVRRCCEPRSDFFTSPGFRLESPASSFSDDVKKEMAMTTSMHDKRMSTVSSFSLAGSMCKLPKHKPYNAHDDESLVAIEETEKEHAQIDYTARSPHVSITTDKKYTRHGTRTKRISFQYDSEEEVDHAKQSVDKQSRGASDEMANISYKDNVENVQDIEESVEEELYVSEEYETVEDEYHENGFHFVNAMNEDVDTDSDDDELDLT